MIKGFLFEDFKGFQKAELFLEDISILIGTNASGKSNAIEGIEILSEIATGKDFVTVLDGSRNSESFVRGGSKGCCRFKSTSFGLGCLVDLDSQNDLLYKIRIKVGERVYVESESLSIVSNGKMVNSGNSVFSTKKVPEPKSANIQVAIRNGKKRPNPEITCLRDTAIFHQLKNQPADEGSVMAANVNYINLVLDNLKRILVLSPNPDVMGGYCRKSDNVLKHDCSNLSAALHALSEDTEKMDTLLSIIRQLPENEIRDMGFLLPGNGDVLFYLEEKYMSSFGKVYANQLSAGTLRAIAVITALLEEEEGSLVIIDEVDNGLHPSRAKALVSWMIKINKERKVDILITTHNVSLLNSLKGETILGVSVAYRDEEKGLSQIIPFVDMDNHAYILASGGIGSAEEKDQLIMKESPEQLPEWLEVDE